MTDQTMTMTPERVMDELDALLTRAKELALHITEGAARAALSRPAVPEGVIRDAASHLTNWLDMNWCECEGGHTCGRNNVVRTRDQLLQLLAAAPEPASEPCRTINFDDIVAWADGVQGALGTEHANRVTEREAAASRAVMAAIASAPNRCPHGVRRPHECKECADAVPASEALEWAEREFAAARQSPGEPVPVETTAEESLMTEQPEDGPVAVIRIIPGSSPRDDLESHPVIALHRPSARNRSVSLQQDDDTNVVQWHVQSPDGFWRPVGHRFSLPSEVAIRTRLWHENQRLRERVKGLEADAARYRWLRSKGFGFSHDEAGRGISAGRWGEWHMDSVEGFAAQADAAIDAAMQEGKS